MDEPDGKVNENREEAKSTVKIDGNQCEALAKFPHIYSIKIDETSKWAFSKSYVLIETTSNEEHNLTMNLLKSKFPSASIFSSKDSETNEEAEVDGTSTDASKELSNQAENPNKSTTDFLDRILKVYQNCDMKPEPKADAKSPDNRCGLSPSDGSMERQESKDSGYWSLTKCSFESMKSLSLNDTIPNDFVTKLLVNSENFEKLQPLTNTSKFNNVKKWKKEHMLRYNSDSDTNKCMSESFEESYFTHTDNPNTDSKAESIDGLASSSRNESLDTENEVGSANSTSTGTSTPQKRRGKLMRDITIDDESQVAACENPIVEPKTPVSEIQNNKASLLSKPDLFCKSPPEKRPSLVFYEKKMSIDETPLDVFPLQNDVQQVQQANQAANAKCKCFDCEREKNDSNLFGPGKSCSTSSKGVYSQQNTNQQINNKSNLFTQSVSFDSYKYNTSLLPKLNCSPYLVRSSTYDERFNSNRNAEMTLLSNPFQDMNVNKDPNKISNLYNFNFELANNISLLKAEAPSVYSLGAQFTKSNELNNSNVYQSSCNFFQPNKSKPVTLDPSIAATSPTAHSPSAIQTSFLNSCFYNANNIIPSPFFKNSTKSFNPFQKNLTDDLQIHATDNFNKDAYQCEQQSQTQQIVQ
jgi:hypothetical protein